MSYVISKINIFLIITFLVGCSPATTKSQPQDNAFTVVPNKVPTTNSPTATFTLSPTLLSTDTPPSENMSSCLQIVEEDAHLGKLATGTVVLGRGLFSGLFLRDLQTAVEYEVPPTSGNEFYYNWSISPDKNLLAISDTLLNADSQFKNMKLSILNARAEELEKTTFNVPGLSNIRWLDNQNIILDTHQTPGDGTVIFFNPFTREQRYITNNLPDFYADSYLLPGLSWLIEYSPSLEWGVYLGRVQTGKLGFVIRDFISGQTVWQKEDRFGEFQRPIWSPNGDKVAVVAGGQLYLVSRDGQAKSILSENEQSEVSQPAWSPNGRYIAFWNIYDRLMLYDSQNEIVFDLCFKGDHLYPLIWSADSRQFAIPGYAGESGILIDVQENKAYHLPAIPEIVYPRGWMNSIP